MRGMLTFPPRLWQALLLVTGRPDTSMVLRLVSFQRNRFSQQTNSRETRQECQDLQCDNVWRDGWTELSEPTTLMEAGDNGK